MAVCRERKDQRAIVLESVMTMLTTRISKLLATAAGAAVLGFGPALASARPHFDDVRVDVDVRPQPCAPVVEERVDRVWVEPTYRTVCDRVWVAPVTEDREVHTWVPDRYESQDVVVRVGHHHEIRREDVLVEPAHDVCQRQQVVVCAGHWEDVQRQVVVCPGHFEDRAQQVIVEPRHEEHFDIGGWLHFR
jgi:hypothetical protein